MPTSSGTSTMNTHGASPTCAGFSVPFGLANNGQVNAAMPAADVAASSTPDRQWKRIRPEGSDVVAVAVAITRPARPRLRRP